MRRLWILAFVVPVSLSACSGDPEAEGADPTSSSVASSSPPTSEATTTEPTEPATSATPERKPLGPEATVRAWVKARNKLLRTGDPSDVASLSSPRCTTCNDLNDGIAENIAEGGYYRTKGWSVNGARRDPDFSTNRVVHSALIFAGGVTLTEAGADPISYPEERNFIDFTLARQGDAWTVERLVFLDVASR